jgi:hypothetical protein
MVQQQQVTGWLKASSPASTTAIELKVWQQRSLQDQEACKGGSCFVNQSSQRLTAMPSFAQLARPEYFCGTY